MSDSLYEAQALAAKYKAERDLARQELDRLREELEAMRPRLMPEGYEWPRYESGEPLRYEDRYVYDGREREVWHVDFDSYGKPTILNKDGTRFHPDKGERVKRHAVSASNGDGCCEPGAYRCQEVAFTCDSCGHTVFVDKCMVDEIRYLRAKGIRTLNCCCVIIQNAIVIAEEN